MRVFRSVWIESSLGLTTRIRSQGRRAAAAGRSPSTVRRALPHRASGELGSGTPCTRPLVSRSRWGPAGNTLVTGFGQTLRFGPDGALRWQQASEGSRRLRVDDSGNSYVGGSILAGSSATWTQSLFVSKFDGSGGPVWAQTWPDTAWEWGTEHARDAGAGVGRNPHPLRIELAAVITPVSGFRTLGGGQGGRLPNCPFDPLYRVVRVVIGADGRCCVR